MALSKEEKQNTGAVAKYWNIGAYEQDFRNKSSLVTLYGYLSEKDRQEGSLPVAAKQIRLPSGDKFKPDMSRKDLYKFLKSSEDWEESKDA